MTKSKTKPLKIKQLYRVVRSISDDNLEERHEAGSINVDLSKWPPAIIRDWTSRGILEVME